MDQGAHAHGHAHHGHAHHGHEHHSLFADPEKAAKLFENEERDEYQKPNELISLLNIPETSEIADIGAGTGYFSVRFARIATKGTVYAVDLEPQMVAYLKERAAKEELANIVCIQGDANTSNLPHPVDIIFSCATYHHLDNRVNYFLNLKGSLKQGGILCIVDWKKGDLPVVGPPEYLKLSAEEVIGELEQGGYQTVARYDNDFPYHYVLLCKAT